MNGLSLSAAYFEDCGLPMLKKHFPHHIHFIAAGLVGEGSECLGFDDDLSRDHDFGPRFTLWIPDDLSSAIAADLQEKYDALPATFRGHSIELDTAAGKSRVGVQTISSFCYKYLGGPTAPTTHLEWLRIPDHHLASATNGAVFLDISQQFSSIRADLLRYYPDQVIRKKLAAHCAYMAQSGQYNYIRSMQRGHYSAAYLACHDFITHALGACYLLNHLYMPFYKWAFRGTVHFTRLSEVPPLLEQLIQTPDTSESGFKKIKIINRICTYIIDELNHQYHVIQPTYAMLDTAEALMQTITSQELRNLHIFTGG